MPTLKLIVRTLYCHSTNEGRGHDEIYLKVWGKNGDGTSYGTEDTPHYFPAERKDGDQDNGTTWDFNDNDQDPGTCDRWLRYLLYEKPIKADQKAEVTVAMWESDSDFTVDVNGLRLFSMTDDRLGRFTLKISVSKDGKLTYSIDGVETVYDYSTFYDKRDGDSNNPNGFFVNAKGSGADYGCFYNVLLLPDAA
jgi:hypothetical protein